MAGASIGSTTTIEDLSGDPHELLARLREHEPVSWVPALNGWLVTQYALALEVMRDAGTYTVADERFSTARVIGPSMLSLDGPEHDRHRAPFVAPFRLGPVRERFATMTTGAAAELAAALRPRGAAELRVQFARPLAAGIVTRALGLGPGDVSAVLDAYGEIVAAVGEITAGLSGGARGRIAFAELGDRLRKVIERRDVDALLADAAASSDLAPEELLSNAGVLLFGGIETTEGMIATTLLHLLERPSVLADLRRSPELAGPAVEESLRLEPAAAVIDRYATREAQLGPARIRRGDLVRVSLTAANRDPAVFADPDAYNLGRTNARRHLAFAQGPHVCVGVHLARLEARLGVATLIDALPSLRLDPGRPARVSGLVFRKPDAVPARWGP